MALTTACDGPTAPGPGPLLFFTHASPHAPGDTVRITIANAGGTRVLAYWCRNRLEVWSSGAWVAAPQWIGRACLGWGEPLEPDEAFHWSEVLPEDAPPGVYRFRINASRPAEGAGIAEEGSRPFRIVSPGR